MPLNSIKEQATGPIAAAAGGAGYTLQMFSDHLSIGIQIGSAALIVAGLILTLYQIRNAKNR
mgnify:CR=1 FL=1